jgi:hypothetical protein
MIVYACSDLIFATKVRATAEALAIATRPTRDAEALRRRLNRVDDGKGNDPVTGVIIDLDLGDAALALIRQVAADPGPAGTSGPPAPRPQVVAFGSHAATALLDSARAAGADFVLPRSQFTANLPTILQRLAAAPQP